MIIPHHEIANLPFMLVKNFLVFGNFKKLIQNVIAFSAFQPLDLGRH